MRALIALVLLAACQSYAHTSTVNAPGNVDLAVPMPLENGDPAKFEAATEPGASTVAIIPAPYVVGGLGRYEPGRDGAGEVGIDIRIEHTSEPGKRALLVLENWGVTVGFGIAQWGDNVRTVMPGAFSAELNYRFFAKTWPIDMGLGPAFYVDDSAIGAQLSVRCAIALFRARYVANTGAEFLFGAQIPVPFFFGWSR